MPYVIYLVLTSGKKNTRGSTMRETLVPLPGNGHDWAPLPHSMGKKQEEPEVSVQFQGYHVTGITEARWGSSHSWSTGKAEHKDRQARRGRCLLCERARECMEL